MNLTPAKKRLECKKQINQMVKDCLPDLLKKLDKALSSKTLPDDYFEQGNFLISKAVLDSFCKDRPFEALSPITKKEFNKIHVYL